MEGYGRKAAEGGMWRWHGLGSEGEGEEALERG